MNPLAAKKKTHKEMLEVLQEYSDSMVNHISQYTIGQYQDYPNDRATHYTITDCIWQIDKYIARFNSNQRPGQSCLDLLKIGHYCAITAGKISTWEIHTFPYRIAEWTCFFTEFLDFYKKNMAADVSASLLASHSLIGDILDYLKTAAAVENTNLIRLNLFTMIPLCALAWSIQKESKPTIRFKRLHEDAKTPEYKTFSAVGADLSVVQDYVVSPKTTVVMETGIAVEIPNGFEGQLRPRSSMAKKMLILLHSVGTIDPDYRGGMIVPVYNIGSEDAVVLKGERIAQLIVAPAPQWNFVEAKMLTETVRGTGGFGHTGTH